MASRPQQLQAATYQTASNDVLLAFTPVGSRRKPVRTPYADIQLGRMQQVARVA